MILLDSISKLFQKKIIKKEKSIESKIKNVKLSEEEILCKALLVELELFKKQIKLEVIDKN